MHGPHDIIHLFQLVGSSMYDDVGPLGDGVSSSSVSSVAISTIT